jgi:Killer toxin-resistance protein 1
LLSYIHDTLNTDSNMRTAIISAVTLLLGLAAALPTEQTASPYIIPETLSTSIPSPSTPHLELRQGVAVTAAPPAATIIGQVSPITTVQIGYVKDGQYIQVQVVYTQTFVTPVDQWPSATAGSIGLGTIEGVVGVVKTKRDVVPVETQLPTPEMEHLILEGPQEALNESPIEDGESMERRDLVMTTEALNKLLAALPVEYLDGEKKKRGLSLTAELLDSLIAKRDALTTEELDTIMAALPVENK